MIPKKEKLNLLNRMGQFINKTIFFIIICLCLVFNLSKAQSVTLSSPSTSSTNVNTLTTQFSIADPLGNPTQIQVVFTCTSGYCLNNPDAAQTITLTMKSNAPAPGSFLTKPLDLYNVANSYTTVTVPSSKSMTNGYYTVYCQYVRPSVGTTLKSTNRTNVFVSVVTPPPSFDSPISNSASSDSIPISYLLKSPYLSNTAQLIFNGPVSSTVVLIDNTLSATFKLYARRLSTSPFVQSATTDSLLDGNYTVNLSYADIYGHAAVTQTVSNFLLQTRTPIPVITKPNAGDSIGHIADTLKYSLPFPPKNGTVLLTLKNNSNTYSNTLGNGYGSQSFIYGSSSIIPGKYEISLSYQDSLNNPVATTNIDSVYIGNNTAPSISFNKPPTICQGDSVILTSNANGGNQWYFNGNPISGATNISYAAKSAGDYTLTSTYIGSTNNGYISPTSNALNIVVNQLPSVIINENDTSGIANNDNIICRYGSTSLTASGASTYLWNSSDTTATIIKSPTTTTTYSVTGIDLNGCAQTNSKTITVNDLPSTPIVLSTDTTTMYSGNKNYLLSNGFTVIGGIGGYYQWYVNGAPISGAINNTYKVMTSGDYTVDYTDANSCKSNRSNTMTITFVPLPNTNNSNGSTGQRTAVDKNGRNVIIF